MVFRVTRYQFPLNEFECPRDRPQDHNAKPLRTSSSRPPFLIHEDVQMLAIGLMPIQVAQLIPRACVKDETQLSSHLLRR